MALPKVIGYTIALLALFYCLDKHGCKQSVKVFFEELMDTTPSYIHARHKRAVDSNTSLNSTNYVIQAVVNISDQDLLSLQTLLSGLSFPFMILSSVNVTSINTTTVCSPNVTGYQCRCEQNFAWSYNSCIANGACDAIIDDTCGCINALPSDSQYCQLNISQPVTTPSTSTKNVPIDIDAFIDLQIPMSNASSNVLDNIRKILRNLSFPYTINQSLTVTSINFTTECFPNTTTGELLCQCEQQFAWPCNKCKLYNVCSNDTSQSCECLDTLPYDEQFCEPMTGVGKCPPAVTSPTPTPNVTAPTPTATPTHNVPVDIEAFIDLQIPMSNASSNVLDNIKEILRNLSFPYTINQSLTVTSVNFTTECFPNTTTGELLCQCEQQFAWPCNKCKLYNVCSNDTSQSCECLDTLPYDEQFCEPMTGINICPPPTTVPSTTTTSSMMTTTTTAQSTMTTPATSTTATTAQSTMTTPTTSTTATTAPSTTTPTTSLMTTTTAPSTTTPTTVSSVTAIDLTNASFTMDLPYDSSYSNKGSKVYNDINNAIQNQSHKYILALVSANIIAIRNGSTIVDYNINAPSVKAGEITAVQEGIFSQLGSTYPMIFDSPDVLQFAPQSVFYGQSVNVICGPVPVNLNFGSNWIATWSRDGSPLPQDSRYTFSTNSSAGTATLSISKIFTSENGLYKCTLTQTRTNGSSFQQSAVLTVIVTPVITVSPVTITLNCERDVTLNCSVTPPYEVEFIGISAGNGSTISYLYSPGCATLMTKTFTCQVLNYAEFQADITVKSSSDSFDCSSDVFGDGKINDIATGQCLKNQVGQVTEVCKSGGWEEQQNNCVLKNIFDLLEQSQSLSSTTLPSLLSQLSNVTVNFTQDVVGSPATINAMVQILSHVAQALLSLSISIDASLMKDVLVTAGILTTAQTSWVTLNQNFNTNISSTNSGIPQATDISSQFLQSLENITHSLTNDSFNIETTYILLNKTLFNTQYSSDFNSSVDLTISDSNEGNKSLTVVIFSSMDNVLPARNEVNSTSSQINGKVALVQSSGTVTNISLTFDVINKTLTNPECVYWNFSLFNGLGGWDNVGCYLVNNNQTVTCSCNHLTSFSILMSSSVIDDPVLDSITYVGVSISMASLVICLIIEAVIWRKIRNNTIAYLRHVSIVNIAVSLLTADIWFIIGAAISAAENDNKPACSAATFFIHYFYLALFFWMLASALLLVYRTINVFDGGLSKTSMLAIGFFLGYGAPLIIVIITIAVTAPKQEYIQGDHICWLNWNESKALLAFVIPALTIVLINFIILLVVIYKMLRRRAVGSASNPAERHALVVIARTLAVLTPFFGLTWGLGVGTMVYPLNRGINIAFAFFNSLQGFFILVFGTLLDKKVRSELAMKSQTSSGGTRTTSAGISSSGGLGFFRNWNRARDGYNVSSGASGSSHSFSNS